MDRYTDRQINRYERERLIVNFFLHKPGNFKEQLLVSANLCVPKNKNDASRLVSLICSFSRHPAAIFQKAQLNT